MLECANDLLADMPALQLRKWLSLFGSGQISVWKHPFAASNEAWQNAVLVSNTSDAFLGRHEIAKLKTILGAVKGEPGKAHKEDG